MGDIFSLRLLLSFILLGLFPWFALAAVRGLQRRRVYRRWRRPRRFDRNLIVIGAGAGGLVSAYIAATVKASVTLVEANKMGDRKSTRLNSSHVAISYAVFCLKKNRYTRL